MSDPPLSRAALVSRLGGPVLFLLALAWAYWDLWLWDPSARHHQFSSPTETWFFSAQATSPPLVFALSAWLMWRRREAFEASLGGRLSPLAGLSAVTSLVAGSAFGVWAHLVSAPHLLIPSLSLVLLGTGLWCGGWGGARAVAMPAGFVLFASPLPSVLVNESVFPLQIWTGQASAAVAEALGRSSMIYGDLIATDTDLFQVIETCSGLRTIMTLLMAALLYGEGFSKSPLRTALLVAAAPALAMVANVVRVASILMNPFSQFAEIHTLQGMVTIFGGVLMLGLLDALVSAVAWSGARSKSARRSDSGSEDSDSRHARGGLPAAMPGRPLSFVLPVALLASVVVGAATTPAWKPTKNVQPSLWKLPRALPESRDLRIDNDFLGSVGFTQRFLRRFEYDGGVINLFIGLDTRTDGTRSLLSPKTLYPQSGFALREGRRVTVEPGNREVDEAVLDSRQNSILVFHWRIDLDSPLREGIRAWLELGRSPLHDGLRAGVVRLSTRIPHKPSGRDEAEARLRGFLKSIGPTLEQFELL